MTPEVGKGKVGRQGAAKTAFYAAIDKELQQNPPGGVWDVSISAYNAIDAPSVNAGILFAH